MAFVIAALKQSKSGSYAARKGIPRDVRVEYQRLHGPAWKELFHAPAGTLHVEAKARFNDWLAEVETRIDDRPE
jgi:hypothetical protein